MMNIMKKYTFIRRNDDLYSVVLNIGVQYFTYETYEDSVEKAA